MEEYGPAGAVRADLSSACCDRRVVEVTNTPMSGRGRRRSPSGQSRSRQGPLLHKRVPRNNEPGRAQARLDDRRDRNQNPSNLRPASIESGLDRESRPPPGCLGHQETSGREGPLRSPRRILSQGSCGRSRRAPPRECRALPSHHTLDRPKWCSAHRQGSPYK